MSRNPSVSLTAHQQAFVADLVASGRYHGVSEVIRAGLRLLEDQEVARIAAIESLRADIRKGFDDVEAGLAKPFDRETLLARIWGEP